MGQPSPGSGGGGGRPSPDLATELGRYAGFGLTIGAATALFAWVGTLLDARLGTEPLFVLVGAFLGFGAGFYSMYRRLVPRPGAEGADRQAAESGDPSEAEGGERRDGDRGDGRRGS